MRNTLTPVQQHGGVWLKRDDLYEYGGVAGGKVRTCVALAGLAEPFTWKVSAAWASKPLMCTLDGIVREGGCGGTCCTSRTFWPPRTGEEGCPHLTDTGCSFTEAERPVKCLLYPLMPNKNRKLIVHHRAATGHCKPNWGLGPPIVEALHTNLVALFGADQADRMKADVLAGKDTEVRVPAHVAAALDLEEQWEAADIVPEARRPAPTGLITAGAAHSPQVNIVARVAAAAGIPARCHVPARKERTPELAAAAAAGAELIEHRPGYNSVIVSRAEADAAELADAGWVYIPFGMEDGMAVEQTRQQVANLPAEATRLVVPVGSGMSLAGILHGLLEHEIDLPVVGVVVGADPTARLDEYAPPGWRDQVQLVEAGSDYDQPAEQTSWEGVELDAHYEAKCIPHLQDGDVLWVVGIRQTQEQNMTSTPATVGGPAIVDYTPDFPVADLVPYRTNPRQGDVGAIAASLQAHGQYRALVANKGNHASVTNEVLAGNHTLQAMLQLGWDTCAVEWVDVDDDQAARIVLVDNRTNDLATYHDQTLADLLATLAEKPAGLTGTGFSEGDYDRLLAGLRYGPADGHTLRDRFVVPPFSVLDARQGYWTKRKDDWLALGIRGEEGRQHMRSTVSAGDLQLARGGPAEGGGSVFDPVLAELAYRWYAPPAGHILDPFAGGTTRGAVAGVLGYPYTGVELREEQVEANYAQLPAIPGVTQPPVWLEGDSAQLPAGAVRGGWRLQVWEARPYDLIFTSPPYYDLEAYSGDQLDGSAKPTWAEFCEWYADVFGRAVGLLEDNRYAIVVVGEIRDRTTGVYRNLLGLTVDTFTQLGLHYYGEYIYVTPVGSLAIRTAAQFPTSRKPGKGHQNMLVFWKGDPAAIRDFPPLPEEAVGDVPALPDRDEE